MYKNYSHFGRLHLVTFNFDREKRAIRISFDNSRQEN